MGKAKLVWLTPRIPTIQKAEIRRIVVLSQSGQISQFLNFNFSISNFSRPYLKKKIDHKRQLVE
jgi:hypothetical protein